MADETKLKPAFACDYARMWDLVRHQRGELLDEGLITREEYAILAAEETKDKPGQGSPSPRRLEIYDEVRARLEPFLRFKSRDDAGDVGAGS